MDTKRAFQEVLRFKRMGEDIPLRRCCQCHQNEISHYFNPNHHPYVDKFQIIQYSNGYYYGMIKDGQKNDFGYYIWNDGIIYGGEWLNEKKHGDGIQIHSDGYIMFGEYKDDKWHGHCLSRNSNGIEIEADYQYGKIVRVWPSSDDFVDETGKEYSTRKFNKW